MREGELMTNVSVTRAGSRGNDGIGALKAATTIWFGVMVISQWLFVYYIAAFYAEPTLSGQFAAWNEHPFLSPFVRGDIIGNLAFATHVMLAIFITFGGTLQLIPQLRATAPWLHRWNGRLFILFSLAVTLAGFYMVWLREPVTDISAELAISINGALILLFAALAWREGIKRSIVSHRRWALRALLAVNGVFFLRLVFSGWLVLTQREPDVMQFRVFEYASYLVPLLVLQLYLYSSERGGTAMRYLAAMALYLVSAAMCIGAFGFSMIFVRLIVFGQS
ncbi:DUF2306 domain-containing protein [Marinicauda algicola]|uniref:DUF2306 domain-containing protein n=2 Tax=Marinicauda algicola TaxID=2029849 RepID=A0A4S2H1V5_9PROT|nr:DUF2306 domain-containing protein [Marinicauda algicola]